MKTEITKNNYSTYSQQELFERIKELQSDLLDEKNRREKLQDYIDSIIDNSPTAIMIIDAPDGNISYINDAVWDFRGETDAKMTGISVEEYVNTWKEYYPDGRQYTGEEMPVARSLLHGEVIKGEELIVELEDGTRKWASAWSNPIHNSEGEVLGALLLFYDVTEKKNYELELIEAKNRADLANKAKSVFLANMSHELRTPLNAILGYSQILLRHRPEGELTKGLTTIQQSGEHLLALINDILDTAKIETGKVKLSLEVVHLETFLETIMTILHSSADAKNVEVVLERPANMVGGVLVDTVRLRQVLLNLLNNAVKFTSKGAVTLNVAHLRSDQQNDTVQLLFSVTDTGVGIEADQLEQIFLPFEQASDELTGPSGGSGLGLYISRQLVSLMGGELTVDSEPGRGSIFSFTLFVSKAKLIPIKDSTGPAKITGYKGPRRRVLVVDDTVSNRLVLMGMLQPMGFTVSEAADGHQAVEAVRADPPDLILMDRYMPVMDGLTAIEHMRRIPEIEEVPVLAVSASVAEEDKKELLAAGFDGFVSKPVHWPQLTELLQTSLDLEWYYSEEIEAQKEGGDDSRSLVPPPMEELSRLQRMCLVGDMEAIISQVDRIELQDQRYGPFASRLRELAEAFDDRNIQQLLEQYMEVTS